MRIRHLFMAGAAASYVGALSLTAAAQAPADGPQYVNGNSLVRPANYREWIFVGSGLGMTYEGDSGGGSTTFSNVFVNPAAYRGFMQTGTWPNGSVFVLEFRRSRTEGAPNVGGRYQTDLVGLEAEVKDRRFADEWAFYNFRLKPDAASTPDAAQKPQPAAFGNSAAPLAGAEVERCVECHTKQTAVERTFVQFYPTLLEVARQKGTVKAGF